MPFFGQWPKAHHSNHNKDLLRTISSMQANSVNSPIKQSKFTKLFPSGCIKQKKIQNWKNPENYGINSGNSSFLVCSDKTGLWPIHVDDPSFCCRRCVLRKTLWCCVFAKKQATANTRFCIWCDPGWPVSACQNIVTRLPPVKTCNGWKIRSSAWKLKY